MHEFSKQKRHDIPKNVPRTAKTKIDELVRKTRTVDHDSKTTMSRSVIKEKNRRDYMRDLMKEKRRNSAFGKKENKAKCQQRKRRMLKTKKKGRQRSLAMR